LELVRTHPADALTTTRRAFDALKGSGPKDNLAHARLNRNLEQNLTRAHGARSRIGPRLRRIVDSAGAAVPVARPIGILANRNCAGYPWRLQ